MGSVEPAAGPPLAMFGIDHHRAAVAVRERVAVAETDVPLMVERLRSLPGVTETAVLSTCNRMEIYLAGAPAEEQVLAAIAAWRGLDPAELAAVRIWRQGTACAKHLFRVASGLESLVLGEDQIQRQLKDAYERSRACGGTGTNLNLLFQRALAVGKEVRTDTGIGRHKLSVASVAVDLARHVLGDLSRTRLLMVGAGEMAELVLTYLLSGGVRGFSVVNRKRERADALAAQHPGRVTVRDWSDLGAAIAESDLVITSTAAPHAVIPADMVGTAMRRRRSSLVFIDVAVPRDVDPEASRIDEVYLYNIDHLERVVGGHREQRSGEIASAEALIAARLRAFCSERRAGRDELLAAVAAWFDDVVEAEAARLGPRLRGDAKLAGEVRYGLQRIAGKLQHRMLAELKSAEDPAAVEAMMRRLLGLGQPSGEDR
jgi:glutamyl-tRNA reductase